MVIDRFGPPDDTKDAFARDTQLYVSRLADSYATFDRKLFIETLNDWGWFAQDRAAPHWYTGRPWS
jgi:hypothetical protein